MKKGIVAGLVVLCLALGASTVAVVVTSDRKGPEIKIPSGADVIYEEGGDTAVLLEGVTATDDKDGDVTDSLVIENIFPNDDYTSASVIYAAKDSHNNVTKVTRRVDYKTTVKDTLAENEPVLEENNSAMSEEPAPEADNGDAADEPTPAAEEPQQNDAAGAKNEADAQTEIEELSAESPRLYLNTYEVTVEAGNEMDKISYIKEMIDDVDSQETLFNEIEIDGDVDTAVPGDYTLTYHVTDSDGNRSNAVVLTVHVQ